MQSPLCKYRLQLPHRQGPPHTSLRLGLLQVRMLAVVTAVVIELPL